MPIYAELAQYEKRRQRLETKHAANWREVLQTQRADVLAALGLSRVTYGGTWTVPVQYRSKITPNDYSAMLRPQTKATGKRVAEAAMIAAALLGIRAALSLSPVSSAVKRMVDALSIVRMAEQAADVLRTVATTSIRRLNEALYTESVFPPAQDVVDAIDKTYSEDRAKAIAVTAISAGYVAGMIALYQHDGKTQIMRWVAQEDACPVCQALHGSRAPVNGFFPGGMIPPVHVNCRCIVTYEKN